MLTPKDEMQALNEAIAALDSNSTDEGGKNLRTIMAAASSSGHMCIRQRAAAWAREKMSWKIHPAEDCEMRCAAIDGEIQEQPSA